MQVAQTLNTTPWLGDLRKQCSRCKEVLLFSEFGRDPHGCLGMSSRCRACRAAYTALYRKQPGKRDEQVQYLKARREERPERVLLGAAKFRARQAGLLFDLSESDIHIPEYCPILGIRLEYGQGAACAGSPSLDRFDPAKGYVRGNVHVVSFRANSVKSSGTAEEHERIAAWMRSHNRSA
jgi:hypothetical protein